MVVGPGQVLGSLGGGRAATAPSGVGMRPSRLLIWSPD